MFDFLNYFNPKSLLDLSTVIIGVLLALALNRLWLHFSNVNTYNKMLEMIARELENNIDCLNNKHYHGVSFESFKAVEGNPIFISFVKEHVHDVLWKTYSTLREYKVIRSARIESQDEDFNKPWFNEKNINKILQAEINMIRGSKIRSLKYYRK